MKPRPFKTLSSRVVWSCPWYRVRQDEIVTPDGNPGVYNTITKTDAVWIVPITGKGEVVLLYQYRYTVDDWCWEIPAGSMKQGETPEAAARVELREEIGGHAANLEYITRFYPGNGICNEVGHIFLATGVVLGAPAHEVAEVIEVHRKQVADVLHMARSGQISDGPSMLALFLCEDRLR